MLVHEGSHDLLEGYSIKLKSFIRVINQLIGTFYMDDIQNLHEGNSTAYYEIKVKGRIEESMSDWFEDMSIEIESTEGGSTVTTLRGVVADQAALQGIISRIGMLNMTLISVTKVNDYPENAQC
jgi:hypothetical protein